MNFGLGTASVIESLVVKWPSGKITKLETVRCGQKILLIEAMKTFNEIVAPRAGTVTAVLVEDGQPVEFGEALIVIE